MRLLRSKVPIVDTSMPSTWMLPDHGSTMRKSARANVLLPHPVRPAIPTCRQREGVRRHCLGCWKLSRAQLPRMLLLQPVCVAVLGLSAGQEKGLTELGLQPAHRKPSSMRSG